MHSPPDSIVPLTPEKQAALMDAIIASGAVPAEMAPLFVMVLEQMDGELIAAMLADVRIARDHLEAGNRDEALVIVERYREPAEAAGFGPIYEQMRSDIFSGTTECRTD